MKPFDVLEEFQHYLKLRRQIQFIVPIPDSEKYADAYMIKFCFMFNKFDLFKNYYYEGYEGDSEYSLVDPNMKKVLENFMLKMFDSMEEYFKLQKEHIKHPAIFKLIDKSYMELLFRTNNIEFIKYVKNIFENNSYDSTWDHENCALKIPIDSIDNIKDKLTSEVKEFAQAWLLEKKLSNLI